MKILNVSFDRLSLVGNLYKTAESDLQRVMDYNNSKILKAMSSKITAQLYDGNVFIDYDQFQGKAFNKGNFKIDYNPNKLTPEQNRELVSTFKPMLHDLHYTRVDLAFDVDFELSAYTHEHVNPLKSNVYCSPTGKIETMYYGSRQSDFYSRTYDKNVEREAKADLEKKIPVWWRYELEIKNRSAIENMIACDFPVFERVKFKKYGYETLGGLDRLIVQNIVEHPENMGALSKYQRSKYRKIMQEMECEDITPLFERELKKELPQLKRQLGQWKYIPTINEIMRRNWH